jgi:hypothetical protein
MKSFIKKIVSSNFNINLRNAFNIRPVHMSIKNLKLASVSDAFLWRTDNNFTTKFKYSDILNIFYKIKNSFVELKFYSKENKLLKTVKINNLNYSNEIEIDTNYMSNIEDYGTFYIYHYTHDKIQSDIIISNRCYLGYSKNKNLHSFVHGNTLSRFSNITHNANTKSDIVKTSPIQNQNYKIQKFFDNFDKNELFFANPTSKIIKFSIDEHNYTLNNGCSILIDILKKKIINIKSNCLFLRPTVFSYKNNYIDVHHG